MLEKFFSWSKSPVQVVVNADPETGEATGGYKSVQFFDTAQTATATSASKSRAGSLWNYQLQLSGSGAISCEAAIDVSMDGAIWELNAATLSASGTDSATDSTAPAYGAWPYHRCRITSISGTSAAVNVIGRGL